MHAILWDIHEEHLNEATWLWAEWEAALCSPLFAIGDVVVGPEERLLAHLDGLVLGGRPVAEALLVPGLSSDDPGAVGTSALALIRAEDADYQDLIVEKMASSDAAAQAAMGRAFYLSPRADISRLLPLWSEGAASTRGMVLDIFAQREPGWARERLGWAVQAAEPPLVAAALRAIRRGRDKELTDLVRYALQFPQPEVQREAIAAGFALGLKEAWTLCREAAAADDESCRWPLAALTTSRDPNDHAFVRSRTGHVAVAAHAVWALGFLADVSSIDRLVEAMSDASLSRIAGEAFSVATGIPVCGTLATPGLSQGPDAPEITDEDPLPAVRAEDHLPDPNAAKIREVWQASRSRLNPVLRYVHGQPRSSEAVWTCFSTVPTWRRAVLAMEMEMTMLAPPRVDLRDWGCRQQQQLGTFPKPVVVDRKLLALHAQTLR